MGEEEIVGRPIPLRESAILFPLLSWLPCYRHPL